MDKAKLLREYTRQLECKIAKINKEKCCSSGNISTLQCFLIVEIGRQPEISLKELSAKVEADKSLVSRTVDDLVEKEYVERKQSTKDRRKIGLKLLEKGQVRFQDIEFSMNNKYINLLKEIPLEKQDQVIEALRLYIEACSNLNSKSCNNMSCELKK